MPKFKAAGIIPSIQPWLATQAILFAQLYFTYILNSTGKQMFSPDFTQIGFDNDTGSEVFALIEEGFKSGFWDPKYMNITNEHDAYKIFRDGNVATIVESESPIAHGRHGDLEERRHPAAPGLPARHHAARTGGPDGLGVSKFSKNIAACWSWSRYNFSPEVEKAAATTVKDSTGALVLFPVARTSVVDGSGRDQGPAAAAGLRARRTRANTNPWSTPYDTTPVFNEVIAKMISGDYTAAQAHAAAVKGCQDIIIKYLSS